MDNYLIIHNNVNVDGKEYSFLHTFNPRSYDSSSESYRGRPYMFGIHSMLRSYNRQYVKVPSNVKTKEGVKDYTEKLLQKEYPSKYLTIPELQKGFPVSSFFVKSINATTNQKVLYGKKTHMQKTLVSSIGKPFFENLKSEQKIYIAQVKYFVKTPKRALTDRFSEFCASNSDSFHKSFKKYRSHNAAKATNTTTRKGGANKTRRLRKRH